MKKPILYIILLALPILASAQMTKVIPPKLPKSVSFASESVPMNNFEVRERLDRELIINCFMHSKTLHIIKLTKRYEKEMKNTLMRFGIPEDFFYLCVAESALRNQVSPAGAAGMWQFMPQTARGYGMEVNSYVDERNNWRIATVAACKYLKDAYNKFGSWTSAAASYNMGMGGLNSRMASQGERSYYNLELPTETERYVFRIIALKLILQNPSAYGFIVPDNERYPPIPTRKEVVNYGIKSLSSWARSKGTNYHMLKVLNPWLKSSYLTNNSGKQYIIELPK